MRTSQWRLSGIGGICASGSREPSAWLVACANAALKGGVSATTPSNASACAARISTTLNIEFRETLIFDLSVISTQQQKRKRECTRQSFALIGRAITCYWFRHPTRAHLVRLDWYTATSHLYNRSHVYATASPPGACPDLLIDYGASGLCQQCPLTTVTVFTDTG